VRGSIAIGVVWGSIAPVLATYHAAFPDVAITLRQGLSVTLVDDVLCGSLDLAFVGLPPTGWPHGIRVLSTSSIPVGIACSLQHPLARQKKVELGQLAGEVFVAYPGDVASYSAVTKFLAQAGVEYRTTFRVADIPSMLDLVVHGLAIALLPKTSVESQPGICYLPLAEFSPTCIAAVITADRPASVAARTFLDTLEGLAVPI